ncbi:probable transcription factor At5g61620 [Olea europaea var. sylvestris]|uniref:Probable transcription factor At5g61620 n=1 Tax=Olea europaea subsp. europaea TaxID=158383 RepID=A0A8S0RJH7_OLEEU|nr:probable transcription factor At5g61620 [Olea europaea var. sylvestris]CAA2979929.1 probable transcription factor At5g61620 [Olea europaea subsp. europaea]
MAKEPAMRCKDNGHDSTTCNCCTSIRLFGVQINVADDNGKKNGESLMRKSKSLGNLEDCNVENNLVEAGYHSDGFMHQSSISKEAQERKRGKPWSEEEHRSFLVGLEKLGKGDWKGISKNYVPSRNSSQVASHAQKYFIRLSATEKKRRRSSVFDISLTEKASSSDATLKNLSEFEIQASMQPPVTTSEKPPLSPMPKLHGITNFRHVAPYMNYVSLPTLDRTFAMCAPFRPQPESYILRWPLHIGASSQAGPSTGVAKKNALNLSFRMLEL